MNDINFKKKNLLIDIFLIITIPLFFLGYISFEGSLMYFSLIIAWLMFAIKSCTRERIMVFAFSITLFVFLFGKIVVNQLEMGISERITDTMLHTYLCLFLSIHFANFGVILAKWDKLKESYIKKGFSYNSKANDRTQRMRKAAKTIYIFFGLCQLACALEKLILAHILGSYTATFVNFSSLLPSIVTKLSEMADIAFFIYLSTLPNPRKMKLVFGLKILIGLILLAYGMRNVIVMTLILLGAYCILYEELNKKRYDIISKKTYIISLMLIPVVLTFFEYIMAYRDGLNYVNNSIFNSAKHMIISLGGSVSVIEYGYEYDSAIPDKFYSFSGIIDFITQNFIARIFLGVQQYGGNTIEGALYGNSLSNILTYMVKKEAYLGGYGMGSSYIAEVYHDFGYIGVSLINVIYGYILIQFNNLKSNQILKNTIIIMSSYYIVYAPRAYADGFLSCFFNFSFILTLLTIYITSRIKLNINIIKG